MSTVRADRAVWREPMILEDKNNVLQSHDTASSVYCDHGTSIQNLDQPLILYPARRRALDGLNQRFKFLILPYLFCCLGLQIHHLQEWWRTPFLLLLFASVYVGMRRRHTQAVHPIAQMSSEGLGIHSLHMDMFIPWSEIKEVRVYGCFIRMVGIVPKDATKTFAHGTVITQIKAWINAFLVPLYRLFGIFMAPLNILESELPLSAESVTEQINLRIGHAHGLSQVTQIDNPTLELPEF
jgi:hypothetical protein